MNEIEKTAAIAKMQIEIEALTVIVNQIMKAQNSLAEVLEVSAMNQAKLIDIVQSK